MRYGAERGASVCVGYFEPKSLCGSSTVQGLGGRGASRMEEKDINGGEAETRTPKIRKWFKSKTCSPQSINFIPICKT